MSFFSIKRRCGGSSGFIKCGVVTEFFFKTRHSSHENTQNISLHTFNVIFGLNTDSFLGELHKDTSHHYQTGTNIQFLFTIMLTDTLKIESS
jgi:hypothetical protein